MRGGFTPTLRDRVNRHPQTARPILEILSVTGEDLIASKTEWQEDTGTPGFDYLDGGGIKLSGADASHFDQGTKLAGADMTTLVNPIGTAAGSDDVECAMVEWAAGTAEQGTFYSGSVANSGVPVFELKSRSYTAKIATFESANDIDIGAAPSQTRACRSLS